MKSVKLKTISYLLDKGQWLISGVAGTIKAMS